MAYVYSIPYSRKHKHRGRGINIWKIGTTLSQKSITGGFEISTRE